MKQIGSNSQDFVKYSPDFTPTSDFYLEKESKTG